MAYSSNIQRISLADDPYLTVNRQDFSGGVNNRQHASVIGENNGEQIDNWDIATPGQTGKRPGSLLIGNDVSNDTPIGLYNFVIQGATDQLLMYDGTSLRKWTGSGNWANIKTNFSAATEVGIVAAKESGLTPDDVVIVQNGVDNAFRFDSSGNAQDLGNSSDSPPITTVMAWYGNRLWGLKNDLLYYSTAYPADYSNAWNRVTNAFRVPVGTERKLIPTRDLGIIVMGSEGIWSVIPSPTPAATDAVEPILPNIGVVSKNAAVASTDDIYFFSYDGLRALKRTAQDKLQGGASYPTSYFLKTEFERINWAYISQLSMEYFDNKVFISVPTGATTYDTWIYYPATNSFTIITGWSPRCWSRYRITDQEFLYYGKQGNGVVYRAWTGYSDEGTTTTDGTAITSTFIGREEDMGQPFKKKFGGELEIGVEAAGSGNSIDVYASIDGGTFNLLDTIDLTSGTAPILPVTLPFTLSDSYIVRTKLHLDPLGPWQTIQIKLVHNDVTSDPIRIYSYKIATFLEEYDNE